LWQICSDEILIGVTVDLDRVVRNDAEIAWTTATNGVEKLRVRALVDVFDLAFVIDQTDVSDMVA